MVSDLMSFGVQGPSLSKRGDELFYNSTGNPTRLIHTTFDGTKFATPFVISELDVNMPTGYPGLSPDGLMLVFEGTRPSSNPILFSTRTSVGAPWAPEQTLAEASDTFTSQDPELSFDGTELYFSSNRATGGGTFDLYVMTRSCL
jgi:Tol biopolymer transport system component